MAHDACLKVETHCFHCDYSLHRGRTLFFNANKIGVVWLGGHSEVVL